MTQNSKGGFVKTADNAEADTEALRLRSLGHTYREIGERTGVNTSTAYRRVQNALGAIPFDEVDSLRKLEGERLDALQLAIWDKAINGDLRAVDRVLAVMKRRAQLFGLDVPRKWVEENPLAHMTSEDIQREIDRITKIIREHDANESENDSSSERQYSTQ
jgi:hypothetical protein